MNREDYFRSLTAELGDDPRSARLIEELNEHLDDHESLSMIIGKKSESAESVLGSSATIATSHRTAQRTASPLMILTEAAAFGIVGTPLMLLFFLFFITRVFETDTAIPLIAVGANALIATSAIFHIFALRTTAKAHEQTQIRTAAKLMITGVPILAGATFVTAFGLSTEGSTSVFASLFAAIVLFALGAPIAHWIMKRTLTADKNTRFGRFVLWYREHILPRLGTIIGASMTIYILITHYVLSQGTIGLDKYGTFIDAHPILVMLIAAPRGIIELVLMFLHFWFVDGLHQLLNINIALLYAIFFGVIGYVTIVTPIFASYQRRKTTHRFNIPWIAVISIVYFIGITFTAPLDTPKVTWSVPHYDLSEKLERQELGPMYSTIKWLNRLEKSYSKYFAYRYGDELVVTMNNRKMKVTINDIEHPVLTTIGDGELTHGFFLLDSPPANVSCNGKSFTYDGTTATLGDSSQISYFCSSLEVNGVPVATIENATYAGMTETTDGKYAFLLLSTGVYDPSYGYLVELPQMGKE